MTQFIKFLCRKPIFFDVFIFFLLPFYCHTIIVFHRRESAWKLMHMFPYWKALGFTWACALAVAGYIKLNNLRFGRQYGIHDGVLKRLANQWLWNFLPPVLFVLAAVTTYYATNNTSIGERGYFQNEFAFVIIGIFCLVLLYSSFDILFFVVSETEKRTEKSAATATDESVPAIQVHHYFRNELHPLPLHQIGLIEHRNNKIVIYTYRGEKYRLPMPKNELLQFSERHGFHWLSPYYGFAIDAIAYLAPGSNGPLLIALKRDITPEPQIQVKWQEEIDSESARCFIKIHKNNASKVRDWYRDIVEKKGYPESGQP